MIELDYRIKAKGVARRLIPFIPENLREDFKLAALAYSLKENGLASASLTRATTSLPWKLKIKILLIFGFWVNMAERPIVVIAGIVAVPFIIFNLIFR